MVFIRSRVVCKNVGTLSLIHHRREIYGFDCHSALTPLIHLGDILQSNHSLRRLQVPPAWSRRGEMADARDLKSLIPKGVCGFESHRRHRDRSEAKVEPIIFSFVDISSRPQRPSENLGVTGVSKGGWMVRHLRGRIPSVGFERAGNASRTVSHACARFGGAQPHSN